MKNINIISIIIVFILSIGDNFAQYIQSNEGLYIVTTGKFDSGNLGVNNKILKLQANEGECIEISFENFDIGISAELKVYAGIEINNAYMLGSYSGTNMPEIFIGESFTFEYVAPVIYTGVINGWSAIINRANCSNSTLKSINSAPNSDCISAIELCNNGDILPTGQYTDNGAVNDESGSCFNAGGGNLQSAWFQFSPQTSGDLTFDIAPTSSADYDFVLYDITNGCGSKTEMSCNFSMESGNTGLTSSSSTWQDTYDTWSYADCNWGMGNTDDYDNADSDCGRWNKKEYLQTGHTYALMINLYGGTSDFALTWGGVQIGDTDAPNITNANPTTCAGSVLQVDLNESVPCTEVQSSDFTMAGYTFTINNLNCDGNGNTNQIDLNVSPALADGSYSLHIGNIDDNCGNTANSDYPFTISLHPVQYNVTGGGEYCQGTGGITIGLSDSDNGITYTLNLDGTSTGTSLSGNGSALSFGNQLTAGTYTITGDNGCPIDMNGNASITINANPSVVASSSPTSVCDGFSVDLSAVASNGTPSYTSYVWNVGSGQNITTTPNPGAFSGGQATVIYTVTVTDSKGCVGNNNVDVIVYENPTPTITGNTAFCENTSTTIDAGAGYNGYEWDDGTINQTLIVASPGTYYVTVTDAHSCVGTDNITISETPAPTAIVSGGGTICADGSTADIIVNFTGSADWSYEWALDGASQGTISSTTSTQTIPSLTAGTYTLVNVTDNTGCVGTVSGTATITVNPLPTPNITGNLDFCTGLSTTLDAGAGYSSYEWTGGTTNQTLLVTNPGTYIVTVTDGNTCENTDTVIVIENSLPVAVAGTDKEICNGESVNIDANGSSASAPTTITDYNWNIGAGAIQTVSPIVTTTYTVTVIDDNGCEDTDDIQVEVHQLPTANAGLDDEICNGETYTLDASASSAVSPATITDYDWDNSVSGVTQDVSPTTTQTYQLTVTDNFTCQNLASVTINVNQLPIITVDATSPVTNCTNPNGELQISGSGDNPSFVYSIDGNPFGTVTQWDTLNSISHHIVIKDTKGCENYIDTTIANTMGLTIDSITYTEIRCFGDTTSTIQIYSNGIDINYSIDGTSMVDSNTFVNNGAGYYPISVIDNVTTCIASQGLTISEPTLLENSFTTYDIPCFGDSTSVVANIIGGTLGYSINWSTGETTDSIYNIVANTYYYINIIDANLCELNDTVIYTQPTLLEIDTILCKELLCNGDKGEISVGVIGGTPSYTFNWNSTTATDSVIYNLDAGTYIVNVEDVNGCMVNDTINVTEPDSLILTAFSSNTLCENNNGVAGVSVTGGTTDYTYNWSHDNALDNDTAIGLTAGNYSLTVIDDNACTGSVSFVITDHSSGTVQIVSTPIILCYGDTNGEIIASISGGQPNYSYQWLANSNILQETVTVNNFDTLYNVSAGTYTVSITDSLGCITSVNTINVSQPDSIIVNYNHNNIMCYGDNNGQINTYVQGGTSPLTYNWNVAQNTDTLQNLSVGEYFLTVVDANNCKDSSLAVTITEPANLVIDVLSIINPTCNGFSNGSIEIDVTGGIEAYNIDWSDSNILSENAMDLSAGSYSVIVIDNNACKKDTTIVLTQPSVLQIYDTSYVNNYVGYIDVVTVGGTPDYYYSWSNGEYASSIENIETGEYIVTVSDKNNCIAVDTIYLEIPLLIPTVITPNDDGKNDTWKISGISQYEVITINIFNRWGDNIYSYETSGYDYSVNTEKQWNGNWNGKPLPLGTYIYILDLNNGQEPYNGTVTIVR